MKAIQYSEASISSYPDFKVDEYSKKSFKRMMNVLEKFNSVILISMALMLSSKRNKHVEKEQSKSEAYTETGNIILDMYCQEGMKLFHQGEYASRIIHRNEGDELS